MARLFELLFFSYIVYSLLRRLIEPFRRGYREREMERRRERAGASSFSSARKRTPEIDRSAVQDAEFKDLQ